MTRLSEALKRAADLSGEPPALNHDVPPAAWQFPVDDTPLQAEPVQAPEPVRRPGSGRGQVRGRMRDLARRVDAGERGKLVIGEQIEDGVTEQFRHLAAVLHHAQAERGSRSVMVTSAVPSEGKTLTSANLALTISESYQRRVLLVDADLRRPRLQQMFGLPQGPGLTDCLAEPVVGKLPVHEVTDNLWILAAGSATADPMSTLVSRSMKSLIDDAGQTFDWVIVDTPPIAILPDANLLASMIDTAVLVVNAGATPYPMVARAIDAIGRSRILGVVLNRAEEPSVSGHYAYYNDKK